MVVCLFCCIIFSSCDLSDESSESIGQGYFSFNYVTENEGEENNEIICTAECALPIYEYTASLLLVDNDGNVFYESDSKTVKCDIPAETEFQISFEESRINCERASIYRLKIEGKSHENASSIRNNTYNVKFVIGESVISEKTVKGLSEIEAPELDNKEYLTFDGWYFEPEFLNSCNIKEYIAIRDVTLYGKYSFDAEKVSHKIASDTLKSTVSIRSEFFESQISFSADYALTGSGVIFKVEDGYAYVLTNSHVVTYDKAQSASFYVTDGQGYIYNAHIFNKANSKEYDLAILRFRVGGKELAPIKLAQNDAEKGEVVASIGSPNGQINTVTYGRVYDNLKANGEIILNFKVTYHSAIIGEGSSGGALLNGDLELVGINFAGYAANGLGNGLAVPASKILEFITPYFQN